MPSPCCAAFGCRGNYRGEPYTRMVKFPKEKIKRQIWLAAMPNESHTLANRKEIFICATHFDCVWEKVRGGSYPTMPPSVFPGVPKSCFRQTLSSPRNTLATTADARRKLQQERLEKNDKIKDFQEFTENVKYHMNGYNFIHTNDDLTAYMTDKMGRKIIHYMHFRNVQTDFGFIKIMSIEKDGFEVNNNVFEIQKNGYIHKWSELQKIVDILIKHNNPSEAHFKKAVQELDLCEEFIDSPTFQFIQEQLQLFIKSHFQLKSYSKHTVIFALELMGVSPAAYRLIRNSKLVYLPSERFLKGILSKTFQDENLSKLFQSLQPQQRLVNILFDEVKLKEAVRFSSGHIAGYSENNQDLLATSALVFQLVCHYGGPRYIMRVYPVNGLNAEQLKAYLLEVANTVKLKGGLPLAFICDNCSVNQKVYRDLGGPGKVILESIGRSVFLLYDYVHIFKNIRNNWFTEQTKELHFSFNGEQYTASWQDLIAIYKSDSNQPVRLTKLTYMSLHPKPLQRQNVPFVCQVFNEKTVAALVSLKDELNLNEGTVIFVRLITNWFKMLNIKSKYTCIRTRDEYKAPWELNCESFSNLKAICEVISSCRWPGGRGRVKKLTQCTADAFTSSTAAIIEASQYILENYNFQYILPAVFSQDPVEIFFGQARQRSGGNFYIDILDVVAVAKVQQMNQLVKHGIIPENHEDQHNQCSTCTEVTYSEDIDLIKKLDISDTQKLIGTFDIIKQKVVYLAGFLAFKFRDSEPESDDNVECRFTAELSRGGLHVPKLSTVFFVHNAINVYNNLNVSRKKCTKYFRRLLSMIDAPMAENENACKCMTNILFKAYCINQNDTEKEKGCLRRKEKLSS